MSLLTSTNYVASWPAGSCSILVIDVVWLLQWKWSYHFDEEIVTGDKRILTKGRITCHAVTDDWVIHFAVTLLRTEWFVLLRTPRHRHPVLFSRLDNPQNCPFTWGSPPASNLCMYLICQMQTTDKATIT